MPRWQFWRQRDAPAEPGLTPADNHIPTCTATHGTPAPPKPAKPPGAMSPERRERRIGELRRRRAGLLFDIEQGELAQEPENPWQERIALLQESLATIAADRTRLDSEPPEPTWPVPPLPLTDLTVSTDEPARVAFAIDGQPFSFAEASDWDNRGGMVVRGDLRRTSGDPAGIAVGTTAGAPPASWLPLLDAALTAFALAVRDAALAGTDRPRSTTLRDIIREDDEAGGWRNVHGTSNVRVRRAWQRQELRADEARLREELTREQEERRTLVDRLPVARKRLSVLDDELRGLGADPAVP